MVAQSAAPHGPTFTWAPSCASQRPFGSADADPAHKSAQSVTATAAQRLGTFMVPILAALNSGAARNLTLPDGCAPKKKPETFAPGSAPQPLKSNLISARTS